MTPGERYRAVCERVAEAAVRGGRRPEEVVVVVAAKTFPLEAIRSVIAAGARDVGENYVQDALRKREAIGGDVRWHMLGRLQRNKARAAARLFDLIHSLDRFELARDLDAAAPEGSPVRCLVEVNLGGEATKGGVGPNRVEDLLERVARLSRVRIEGLMCIPPPTARTDEARRYFAALRALRDRLADLPLANLRLKELSMGMSGDFEIAVGEGATMVRIGTAIFGARERGE